MPNHPSRRPAQLKMTPAQLRDLLARAGITQQRAADLARVQLRDMERYVAGDSAMPRSVSGALCASLVMLGAPIDLLAPWLHPDVVEAMRRPTAGRKLANHDN